MCKVSHYKSYKFHSCLGNKYAGHRLNLPLHKRHSNAPQSQSVAPQSAARKLRPYMSQEELLKTVPTPFLTAELQAAMQAKGVDGLLQMMYDSGQMVKPQGVLTGGITTPGIVVIPGPGKPTPPIGINPVTDLPYPSPPVISFPTIPINPPIWILPIVGIINACIVNAVSTADSLTAAHNAAKGDRTKPGYGGKCTPDDYDVLAKNQNQACKKAKGSCKPGVIDLDLAEAYSSCNKARENVAKTCFAGGDDGHKDAIKFNNRVIEKCTTGL